MIIKCVQCQERVDIPPENLKWDYSGYGYTAKLAVCPICGQINIVRTVEDKSLDINNDERYYYG